MSCPNWLFIKKKDIRKEIIDMKIKCVICGQPIGFIFNNNLCSFVCRNCCRKYLHCNECKAKICINLAKILEEK